MLKAALRAIVFLAILLMACTAVARSFPGANALRAGTNALRTGANALRTGAVDRFHSGAACKFRVEFPRGGGSMLRAALLAIVLLANASMACQIVERSFSGANALRAGAVDEFYPGEIDRFPSKFPREVIPC